MIDKFPLQTDKLREIPNGFGWVDHRLLRDGHIRNCSSDALALYLLLVCAADGQGLSYYGDGLVCSILGWSHGRLESARKCLMDRDIVDFEAPLYQLLEIPPKPQENKL